jgi:hypothetical protein
VGGYLLVVAVGAAVLLKRDVWLIQPSLRVNITFCVLLRHSVGEYIRFPPMFVTILQILLFTLPILMLRCPSLHGLLGCPWTIMLVPGIHGFNCRSSFMFRPCSSNCRSNIVFSLLFK